MTPPYTSTASAVTATKPQQAQLTSLSNNMNNNAITSGSSQSGRSGSPVLESTSIDAGTTATDSEPPRPLFPTEWKVRPSTAEEREEFRRQERMRYAAPHKAFTYRMHGYASVVGPVKGIYQHNIGMKLVWYFIEIFLLILLVVHIFIFKLYICVRAFI